MKKNIIFAVLFIAFIIVISLLSFLFFSKPIQVEKNNIKLVKESGRVSVKYDGNDMYEEIELETILHSGDEIKTASDSKAKIIFFSNQEVVLDENTQLLINRAVIDANSPFLTKVSLKLKTGQIWNRLQSFLNPEALFEVEAEDVVATVRGTVFNILNKDQKIEVSVFENTVRVDRKNDFTDFSSDIKENNKVSFLLNDFDFREEKEITNEDRQEKWIKENLKEDSEFQKRLKSFNESVLKENNLNLNDNIFSDLGEKIRLFFTFNNYKKEILKRNFEIKNNLINRIKEEKSTQDGSDSVGELVSNTENLTSKTIEIELNTSTKDIEEEEKLEETQNPVLQPEESQDFISQEEELNNSENKDDYSNQISGNNLDSQVSDKQEVSEEYIEIIAEKKVLTAGDQTTLNVFLNKDNKSKDISDLVNFTVNPDNITQVEVGSMRGNIFISNQNGGLAEIIAFYTDRETGEEYNTNITLTVLTY